VNRFASLASFTVVATANVHAVADEPPGESCSVITRQPNGAPKTTSIEGLKVMEQTAKDGGFSLPRGAPKGVQAVLCRRPTVVPAAHDYEVLQAGLTLYLTDDLARMAALGLVEGRVQLDLLDGALTEVERTEADMRLREFQSAIEGTSR
jgi:hypothetical protein